MPADLSAILADKFMGPPNPRDYPPRPLEGMPEEEKAKLSDLWPLMMAQAADLISTEAVLRGGGYESNPGLRALQTGKSVAPAMAVGSLAELLLVHYLTKNRPELRGALNTVLPAFKGTLAGQNALQASSGMGQDPRISGWLRGQGSR